MCSNKICIIGNYPPPAGGRNIHIKNLAARLIKEKYNVVVFDLVRRDKGAQYPVYVKRCNAKRNLIREILFGNSMIFHFHTSSWRYIAIMSIIIALARKKNVITIHSLRNEFNNHLCLNWLCFKLSLRLSNSIICVNQNIKDSIRYYVSHKNIHVVNPYIYNNENTNGIGFPDEIAEYVLRKEPLIVANASANSHYKNYDLYGIDMCIELAYHLSLTGQPFNMIIILTKVTDIDYYEYLQGKIIEHQLSENVILYVGTINFRALLKNASLFLRPTASDGSPLSLLEALASGTPSIASDVCNRPPGCQIFISRNQRQFNTICSDMLVNSQIHDLTNFKEDEYDGYPAIEKIYNHLTVSRKMKVR